MEVYMFQADLHCKECGDDIKAQTVPPEGVDPDNPDECLYDSDDYPKGPFPNGGGESDSPCHCGTCGIFLENPLTLDGYDYLREQADAYIAADDEGVIDVELMAQRAQDDWDARLAALPINHVARRHETAPVAEWLRFYPEAWEPANGYERPAVS